MLNTAGVTLGTGEGGNAFGDRFFVRGFDTRNDIFIDGIRDTGVSVRENFFTEQIEILRGPGSSFAGRGTTGGAINIVTKQATTEKCFYNMDEEVNTNPGERVTLDVNQVISPTFAVRAGGVFQKSDIEGRNYATDNRAGGFLATTWKPLDGVKITTDYIHSESNSLPDFGVPYFRPGATGSSGQLFASTAGGPYPEFRRQSQQLLWLRQSRLLQDAPGYRHAQRRSSDHSRPDAHQQDPGLGVGAELRRHDSANSGSR